MVNRRPATGTDCKAHAPMAATSPEVAPRALASRRRLTDRIGDTALHVITGIAAFGVVVVLGLIVYRLIEGAWPSIQAFGIPFVWHRTWDPVTNQFGALNFLYGTAVTSFAAVLIAGPIAIAIALYLTELAPAAVRGIVGSLVEMLAAVPSVVGLWGIFVLGPFVRDLLRPMAAVLVRLVPALQRNASAGRAHAGDPHPRNHDRPDHGEREPGALQERAARAQGGCVRARAHAVGDGPRRHHPAHARGPRRSRGARHGEGCRRGDRRHAGHRRVFRNPTSLFQPGDTLASRIAAQYQGAVSNLHVASIIYLALILLVFALLVNFSAQLIVNRFEFKATH